MAVERFAGELNIPFIEEIFEVEEIILSDELFLSSSTSEITPIVKVDNLDIADGKPGKITRQLQEAYETDAKIQENNTKHTV